MSACGYVRVRQTGILGVGGQPLAAWCAGGVQVKAAGLR
jgi:hypothetical protein